MVNEAIKKIDFVCESNVRSHSLFIERDNLDKLRGINSGCVDLIYLYPPSSGLIATYSDLLPVFAIA